MYHSVNITQPMANHCLYQVLGQIHFPIAQGRLHPADSSVLGLQMRNWWWRGWGTVEPYIILIQLDEISLQEHRQLAIRTIWVQVGLNHLPNQMVAKQKGPLPTLWYIWVSQQSQPKLCQIAWRWCDLEVFFWENHAKGCVSLRVICVSPAKIQ